MRSNSPEGQQIKAKWRCTMPQSNLVFTVASAAIASLSGLVPVSVHAQASQAGTPSPRRARPPENVRLYKGAARGHWDGDTLVVDSTNFNNLAMGGTFNNYSNTEKAHLIERWKRLDENHLLYGFTIEDPGTWTRPWSIEVVMWRLTDQEQLVEYACHEGNVGLEFTLSGARAKEREQQAEENGDRLASIPTITRLVPLPTPRGPLPAR